MSERCSHTRADGVPCRSYAVEDGLCRAHLKTRVREGTANHVRARLAADAAEAYEQILAAIKQAVTAETTRWGDCPHCRHRVPVSFPDVQARTRALEVWLNQGLGKPVERVETSASEELREQVQAMEEMTDEELRELRLKLIVESVEQAAAGQGGAGRRPSGSSTSVSGCATFSASCSRSTDLFSPACSDNSTTRRRRPRSPRAGATDSGARAPTGGWQPLPSGRAFSGAFPFSRHARAGARVGNPGGAPACSIGCGS
jgi:hypothetical protein